MEASASTRPTVSATFRSRTTSRSSRMRSTALSSPLGRGHARRRMNDGSAGRAHHGRSRRDRRGGRVRISAGGLRGRRRGPAAGRGGDGRRGYVRGSAERRRAREQSAATCRPSSLPTGSAAVTSATGPWRTAPRRAGTPCSTETFARRSSSASTRCRGSIDASGGAIVTLGSVLGLVGGDEDFDTHAYAASKAGIVGLTRAIAVRYAADGVRANVVAPGLIATGMSRASAERATHQSARLRELQPLTGDLGRPEDVAERGSLPRAGRVRHRHRARRGRRVDRSVNSSGQGGDGDGAQGDDAGHGPDRALLHDDAARSARARPGARRVLALGGPGERLRGGLGHPGAHDRPRGGRGASRDRRRRRRPPEPPPRGSDRPGRETREGCPLHEATRAERGGGQAHPRHGRERRGLRRLPRGPRVHAEDAEGGRRRAGRPDRAGDRGHARARRTRGRTAPGSGTPSRRAAGRSSTSAATASRSSATSSGRRTARSRSCAGRTRSSIRSRPKTTRSP